MGRRGATAPAGTGWRHATLAGLAGAVAAGLFLHAFTPLLPGLGSDAPFVPVVVAWVATVGLLVLVAVPYAWLVDALPLATYRRRFRGHLVLGAVYGGLVWATVGALALPLIASLLGLPSPGVPWFSPQSLAAHAIYGLVVGAFGTPTTSVQRSAL